MPVVAMMTSRSASTTWEAQGVGALRGVGGGGGGGQSSWAWADHFCQQVAIIIIICWLLRPQEVEQPGQRPPYAPPWRIADEGHENANVEALAPPLSAEGSARTAWSVPGPAGCSQTVSRWP